MAEFVATQAQAHNMTWPFVSIPKFETFAETIRAYSTVEAFVTCTYVEDDDRDAFVDYHGARYEQWVNESHIINPIVADKFTPTGYSEFIKRKDPVNKSWVPEDTNPYYYVLTQRSPPPTSYNTLNFNAYSVPDYKATYDAGRILKGVMLSTRVRPFASTNDRDHALLHTALPNQELSHPHSFNNLLIREDPYDLDSKVVALVSGPVAWDAALRNLLPDGVRGIHAVIKNNCNDTFTYEIEGKEAYFLGNEDFHDTTYDHKAVDVQLSYSDHPLYEETPGHCMYTMVSQCTV